MEKETKSVFRKSSLERANSPDRLNEYIKTSSASVWIILVAIIILLVGTIVWGVVGKLETIVSTSASIKNGVMQVEVLADDLNMIKIDQVVKELNSGITTKIYMIGQQPIETGEGIQDWVYPVYCKTDLPDGVYRVDIIVDSISPISFILS